MKNKGADQLDKKRCIFDNSGMILLIAKEIRCVFDDNSKIIQR